MSLPSIADYLADENAVKLAFIEPKKEKQPPIKGDMNVLKAGLKGALITAAGTGIGYGTGKLLGYTLDHLAERTTGQKIPTKYLAPTFAALGLLAGAAEAKRMSLYKELLRNAAQNPARRAERTAPGE